MPSKLRMAVGALKDQTSISLAKVAASINDDNLEVMVLRATTHDEFPVEDRYVEDILALVSSHKLHAAVCAQAIARRITKTRNWIVALKSLMLVLRLFQDGDPFFPREVLHAMKRGAKILNLSTFRDDSNSSPWDFTAYIRTFALYLDDRLDCILTGKLQRRITYKERQNSHPRSKKLSRDPVRDMKPTMLLGKISHWQRLLDRAIGTRPTGAAKANRLVKISLYAVVRESFDLYRDISDALVLLLDSFFHLPYQSCVSAFQACVRASRQFEELSAFYELCKSIGVGRTPEYPSVQKISEELLETLQEFLKDQSSFSANGRNESPSAPGSSSRSFDEAESRQSLEDLMNSSEAGEAIVPFSIEQYLEEKEQQETNVASNRSSTAGPSSTSDLVSFDDWPEEEQNTELRNEQPGQQDLWSDFDGGKSKDCWELVLFESATPPARASQNIGNGESFKSSDNFFDQLSFGNDRSFEPSTSKVDFFADQNVENAGLVEPSNNNNFFEQPSTSNKKQYNPFLEDGSDFLAITSFPANANKTSADFSDIFSSTTPTFESNQHRSEASFEMLTLEATPTFAAENATRTTAGLQFDDELFGPCPPVNVSNVSSDQRHELFEQVRLENKDKIVAKHLP